MVKKAYLQAYLTSLEVKTRYLSAIEASPTAKQTARAISSDKYELLVGDT